jgi:8-oxo-dGTP pyrophosphatase MutT (NUDIX family)
MRLQAGCVPVRGVYPSLEVLLVTSRYTGEWIAPKGNIDPDEEPEEAAEREAFEEAGVRGQVVRQLGCFTYTRGTTLVCIDVFALAVTAELESWPERLVRRRKWFALEEALRVVRRPEVLQMLRSLV